jgi:hypothetical protein
MPYTPNANDPTEPIDSRPAGTAAAEFRALKALVAGLMISNAASAGPRQVIQSAVLDSNGYNTALTVGAGLRPGLTASSSNPYHLSYAAGFSSGKAINMDEAISANNTDILGADLPLNNTSLLYRNHGSAYGNTLIPPQYGYTFDRTKGALLNFEGTDASIAMIDDFGNTWTALGNAQIDTAQFKFGTSSLLLDGTGDGLTSASFTSYGDGSWEKSLWFRINALPGVGTNAPLLYGFNASNFGALLRFNNTAGTVRLVLLASSTGSSWDITAGATGTNTTWTLNQWNKIRLVFDLLAGTYRVYLSLNGAAETQDISVSSTARICSIATMRLGSDQAASEVFNGWIDAFRFLPCATKTAIETPSASAPVITEHSVNFFSIPEMKMYEVTAASVTPNVNPTLTAVNRLFLGEADTSGAAITSIKNYAIRGKYRSILSTPMPATSTAINFNHYIGVPHTFIKPEVLLKYLTSSSTGGLQGFIVFPLSYGSVGPNMGLPYAVDGRNTMKMLYLQSGMIFPRVDGSAFYAPGAADPNFAYMMTAERTF